MAKSQPLPREKFAETVKAARDGDADAFGLLYSTIYRELYYIARTSLRSEADAADAVSDAVLDAFRSIGKLRDEAAFRAWMFKILTAKIKQKQREYANAPAELDELPEGDLPSGEFSYLSPELNEAMGLLTREERLLLTMQALGGYQTRELAKIFGSSDSAVRSRLTRIRGKLRAALEEETGREQYA